MSYLKLSIDYIKPRRIKTLVIYIVLFIVFIVLVDETLNSDENLMNLSNGINVDDVDSLDLYKRDRFIKHPKNIQIPTTTTTTTTTTTILALVADNSKNLLPNSDNIINVNINTEFELPKLNMNRLLTDSEYRTYIKSLFFDETNDISVLHNNASSADNDEYHIKECDCFSITTCKCCVNLNLTNIDFLHHTCVYITYDKGYQDYLLDIKLNDKNLIYGNKFPAQKDPASTLCLNTLNSKYCILFTKYIYYKHTIAGCLNIKFELNKNALLKQKNILLINRNIGCFKLPFNTQLTWKDILSSNKTSQNFLNMNQNVAWII